MYNQNFSVPETFVFSPDLYSVFSQVIKGLNKSDISLKGDIKSGKSTLANQVASYFSDRKKFKSTYTIDMGKFQSFKDVVSELIENEFFEENILIILDNCEPYIETSSQT